MSEEEKGKSVPITVDDVFGILYRPGFKFVDVGEKAVQENMSKAIVKDQMIGDVVE